MNARLIRIIVGMLATLFAVHPVAAADDAATLKELNGFWAEISRTVREGDFEGYKATCHSEGVLVSGSKKTSEPLAKALERWKQDFVDARSGKTKVNVEFRFSQRIHDETTAHETGIFMYSSVEPNGSVKKDYIHFEELLVKRKGWKTLMEYQKSKATSEEWGALK